MYFKYENEKYSLCGTAPLSVILWIIITLNEYKYLRSTSELYLSTILEYMYLIFTCGGSWNKQLEANTCLSVGLLNHLLMDIRVHECSNKWGCLRECVIYPASGSVLSHRSYTLSMSSAQYSVMRWLVPFLHMFSATSWSGSLRGYINH